MSGNLEPEVSDVVVVGAGAAGLAVTAALAKAGQRVLLLEGRDAAGTVWIDRVPGLRLNTERRLSSIAGQTAPRSLGRWPSGGGYANYLASVAEALQRRPNVTIEYGVSVGHIDATDSHRWTVETDGGQVRCDHLVLATGKDHVPSIPDLPGVADTTIEVVHAEALDSLEACRDERVLVVGAGNTGTELAHQLTEVAHVDLAIRDRPLFVRRNIAGLPLTWITMLVRWLPDRALDWMGPRFQRSLFGDLEPFGLGPPDMVLSDVRHQGSGPVVDAGFVDAVKDGRIALRPGLTGFDGVEAVFADGSSHEYDTVVMATGYRTGLKPLIGHLVNLDDHERPVNPPELPLGMYAMGFNQSLTAFLPDFDRQARYIASQIDKHTLHR